MFRFDQIWVCSPALISVMLKNVITSVQSGALHSHSAAVAPSHFSVFTSLIFLTVFVPWLILFYSNLVLEKSLNCDSLYCLGDIYSFYNERRKQRCFSLNAGLI